MSYTFKGGEYNYFQIDKHSYTFYKSIKHFIPYLLKYRTRVIVPYTTIRNVLIQKELYAKHVHQIIALQEYDLEIKPTKIVKGQGLCLLASKDNDHEHKQLQWN